MINIIFGLFISLLYSRFILPKNEGENPRLKPTLYPILYQGMIIIPYNSKKALHIHHWIPYLLICILNFIITIPQLILGFSFGLLCQGLGYKDRFQVLCRNPYSKYINL